MKKVILAIIATMGLFAQGNSITTDELTIKGNNPPQVTGAAISVIGNAGNTNYYYWVIVNYPIGKSFPFGPIGAFNAPNTLSVSNYVRVGWNSAVGADSYDVLRTSTPAAPNGSCTCAVTTATTSLFVNDQGAALGAYTISTAGEAKTKMYVNNLSASIPLLTVTGTGWDMSGATATKPNVTGNGAPVGSCLNGSTYQQLDAANIYVCVSNAWSAISGGGGGGVPSGPAGGDLTGTYPNPSLAASGAVAGSYGGATTSPQITVDSKGRITSVSGVTITGTVPGGAASGDLTGTYPAPTLVTTGASAGTYGNATNTPQITVDAKGRITAVSNVAITNTPSGAAGGDLSGTYPNPSVATVGGYSAANVAAGATLANAAVSANTANAIVRRNASGQFAGALIGNADTATTAGAFTSNPTDCTSGQYANAIAANGDLTCAQVAYSQVSGTPSALPPSGSAGGDLTGTYPNPTLTTSGATAGTYGNANQVAQITVDAKGRITSVSDVTITGAAPTGLAGGDLTGNYPNPTLVTSGVVAGSYGSSTLTPVITVDAKGRVTSATTTATSAVPGGAAGGDLSGTYPNPSVATVGGYSAANVAAGSTLANAATDANIANAIVRRNVSGQFSGALIGNADTATAFASNPTDCSAGQYATTIAANGNLTCAQVAYSQLSGTPTSLPPSGGAGGDLTGTYPNPTLTTTGAVAGSYGGTNITSSFTVDAKGRISTAASANVGAGLTGTLTSNGTSMSAVAAATQGQYYRRKYNQTSVTYEFTTAPWGYVSDFAFSYTNGGSNISADLSATGAKTVTVTPCPAGVAGANTNHYLRISGGTGTAESVLITGGTCTSGASSGTLQFTTVQTHTGGWALATATAGLQEAYYSNAPVKLLATDGEYRMYARFYMNGKGGNTVMIQGQGIIATRFIRDSSYAAGDLFYWDGNADAGNLILQDLKILNGGNSFNNTSGSGLYLNTSIADHITLQNIYIENGYNPIRVQNNGTVQSLNSQFRVLIDYPYATSAIWIQNGYYFQLVNTWVTNAKQDSSAEVAFQISQADGGEIVDSFISGWYGIYIVPDSSKIFNFLYVDSNIIDSCYQYGIFVDSTAHNAVFEQMRISNNHIVHSFSGVGSNTGAGIYIANDLKGVQIVNNNIVGWKYTGVIWGTAGVTPPGGAIVGNIIANNNQSVGNGYGLLIYNDTDLAGTTITGNTMNNSASSVNGAYQNCGIYFVGASGTFNGYTVSGNELSGNTVASICTDVTPVFSNFVLGNNGGVDNATGNITSAATITLGIFPQYIVDGSTNVSTINGGWPGRQVQITKSDGGSYTITTGGNIVSPAITMNQYSTALCTFNGPINAWVCK